MDNELLECPYDKSHRILQNRMQVHLGKCRRNHANVPKVTCPFNVIHVLNKPELEVILKYFKTTILFFKLQKTLYFEINIYLYNYKIFLVSCYVLSGT